MSIDILFQPYMQRAMITAGLAALACGVIGVFIVLRGLSFMGAGMAHSAFAGAVLGILIGWHPLLLGLIFAIGMSFGVGYTSKKGKIGEDVSIGILFSFMLAMAIFFIKLLPGYNTEAYGYLFGDVLNSSWEDVLYISLMAIFVVSVTILFLKEFQAITFDEEMALAMGLPVALIFYLMLSLMSVTIVASMSTVGAILVFAMITAPAAAAHQLTHKLDVMIILSVVFAEIAAFGGLFTTAIFPELPPGPVIVFYAVFIFFIAMELSPKRKRLKKVTYKKWGESAR